MSERFKNRHNGTKKPRIAQSVLASVGLLATGTGLVGCAGGENSEPPYTAGDKRVIEEAPVNPDIYDNMPAQEETPSDQEQFGGECVPVPNAMECEVVPPIETETPPNSNSDSNADGYEVVDLSDEALRVQLLIETSEQLYETILNAKAGAPDDQQSDDRSNTFYTDSRGIYYDYSMIKHPEGPNDNTTNVSVVISGIDHGGTNLELGYGVVEPGTYDKVVIRGGNADRALSPEEVIKLYMDTVGQLTDEVNESRAALLGMPEYNEEVDGPVLGQ